MFETEKFKKEAQKLPKKDIDLIIADFDYTIFERTEQFEKFPILIENRGNKGNEVIRDIIGIENLMKECFEGKRFPQGIPSKLRKNHDLILTAGFDEIQKAKLKATGLDKFNHIVVFESSEKPFELIKYVIEVLQFIPNEIIVYEDRPQVFIDQKGFIEDFLGTKLKIMLVKMTSNDEEPTITQVA